ncbi:MAG: hypothetical protein ABR538_02285 [Candidatus Binatia bacterium]
MTAVQDIAATRAGMRPTCPPVAAPFAVFLGTVVVATLGTCFGGPRDGMPCDIQGFDLTFAPVDDELAPTSGVISLARGTIAAG